MRILSTLQQEASKVLNFSTQKTMRLAQQLYEGIDIKGNGTVGVITLLFSWDLKNCIQRPVLLGNKSINFLFSVTNNSESYRLNITPCTGWRM